MSLKAAAQHLASQGRGPDTTLVHMSPREVKSLQELAMAHGGSLSVNPNTGLPEAGFLDSLLPTIVGGAAVALTGGAVTPLMAGLGVGGFEALRSGDLSKGLMAGLGAYGGAGLMGGLMGSGMQAGISKAIEGAGGQSGIIGGGEYASEAAKNAAMQAQAAKAAEASKVALEAAKASPFTTAFEGAKNVFNNPQGISAGLESLGRNMGTGFGSSPLMKLGTTAAAAAAPALFSQPEFEAPQTQNEAAPVRSYAANPTTPTPQPNVPRPIDYRNFVPGVTPSPQSQNSGVEQRYFNPMFYANGGPVEQMSQANSVGANTGYPQADIRGHAYATPWQTPVSQNMVTGVADTGVNPITGQMAFAGGGMSHLGDYSDGGRLLRGPGDGVSDDIPATIGNKQPARLADGEFVVPARIVSELGNGSTESGARKLYAMMDRIQACRKKTMGRGKEFAKDSKAERHLPA